jgi:hypothetical protein
MKKPTKTLNNLKKIHIGKMSLWGICFYWSLNFLFATEFAEKSIKETIDNVVLSKIITKNTMPDNFSLQFDYEKLSESGKWELEYKESITWDFKKKRFFYTRLYSGEKSAVWIKKFSGGKYVSLYAAANKRLDYSSIESLHKMRKSEDFHLKQVYIRAEKFDAKWDVLSCFFYNRETMLPFVSFIEENDNQKNFSLLKSGEILFEGKKNAFSFRYLFNQDGGISRIEEFGELPIKKGVVRKNERLWSWDVKKIGEFNGYFLPLKLEGEVAMISGVDSFFEKRVKHRVVIDEKSVKVNQDLSESDFSLKFPVGAFVYDKARGINYIAEGLDEENEESLGESLEEFMKKAKEEK